MAQEVDPEGTKEHRNDGDLVFLWTSGQNHLLFDSTYSSCYTISDSVSLFMAQKGLFLFLGGRLEVVDR